MAKVKNKIYELIQQKEEEMKAFRFAPSNEWYSKEIRIGKKRFAKILNNVVQPDLEEAQRIADFLGVSISEIVESFKV